MTAVVGVIRPWGVLLGADGRVGYGEQSAAATAVKLHRTPWGAVGLAGGPRVDSALVSCRGVQTLEQAIGVASLALRSDTDQLLLTDGISLVLLCGKSVSWADTQPLAIGSGGQVLLGALLAGVGMRRALQLTAEVCASVGPPYQTMRIRPRNR